MYSVPVLLEIVLPLEGLSADLAGEGHVVLMAALVDHEVVGLGEAPLAVLADELYRALGAHLLPPAELPAVPLCLHRHYREHPYKFPPLLLLVESLSSPFPPTRLSLSLFLSRSSRRRPESLPPLYLSPSVLFLGTLRRSLFLSFLLCHVFSVFLSLSLLRTQRLSYALSFSLFFLLSVSLDPVVPRFALLLPRKASLESG